MSEGKVEVCDNIIAVTSYGNADWSASVNCSLHSFRQMYFLLSWHFVVHETHGKQGKAKFLSLLQPLKSCHLQLAFCTC